MPFRAAGAAAEPVFKGATLLVADVSRGNVGQLAVDLLVATLQMQCVGYFEDPDVLPAVGASILPSHAARARERARRRAPVRARRSPTVLAAPVSVAAAPATRPAPEHGPAERPVRARAAGIEDGKLRVNTELFATADASLFVLQHRSLTSPAPTPTHLAAISHQCPAALQTSCARLRDVADRCLTSCARSPRRGGRG
jgi:hypothetical protein